MPIRIPNELPAAQVLRSERIELIDHQRAARQDIRPMEIAILNLMPLKIPTETQFARLLGASPLQVNLTLVELSTYRGTNTAADHLEAFYCPFEDIKAQGRRFDGLIITGAPVETLEFSDVSYWDELVEIMEWAKTNVYSTFHVCWGAQAALWHHYAVPKYELAEKRFGVFEHSNLDVAHPLMHGIADRFDVPVSRHTENRRNDIDAVADLSVIAESLTAGPCIVADADQRRFYCFNHFEYATDTLDGEYQRDREKGKAIHEPERYYGPDGHPINGWRSHASVLFGNWLALTYQGTPYDLADL